MLITTATSPHQAQPQLRKGNKARQTLESALQALGGLERLRKLDSILFKGVGSEFRSADLQGPDPSTPIRAFHEETTAAFPSQEKILYEHHTGRHDGSFRWRRWMYAGEERTVIDVQDDLISQLRRDPAAATERARIARTIPHLLLLEVATQTANLSWIGKQNYAGKQHDVIGFPLPNTKTTLALFFAAEGDLFYYSGMAPFPAKDPARDRVMKFLRRMVDQKQRGACADLRFSRSRLCHN